MIVHALLPKYVALATETFTTAAEFFSHLRRRAPESPKRSAEQTRLHALFAAIERTEALMEEKYASTIYATKLRAEQVTGNVQLPRGNEIVSFVSVPRVQSQPQFFRSTDGWDFVCLISCNANCSAWSRL